VIEDEKQSSFGSGPLSVNHSGPRGEAWGARASRITLGMLSQRRCTGNWGHGCLSQSVIYCGARHLSLNRHNVTKTGSDWSLFSHRGPVNEVANGAKKSSGIRGIVLQHRVVAGKASDVVLVLAAHSDALYGPESRSGNKRARGWQFSEK
jgi:hypothetical protein